MCDLQVGGGNVTLWVHCSRSRRDLDFKKNFPPFSVSMESESDLKKTGQFKDIPTPVEVTLESCPD